MNLTVAPKGFYLHYICDQCGLYTCRGGAKEVVQQTLDRFERQGEDLCMGCEDDAQLTSNTSGLPNADY